MTETTDQTAALKRLREPFEKHQISLLPKPYNKDAPKQKCSECGGFHGMPAVHLDYVGHAALTDRLLEVDPLWTWEPLALDADGLPKLDKDGGMWIRLTVCGMTRLGYGDAQGKSGGNAVKERIGDALRNAGMRFGAALELWHKGILHMDSDDGDSVSANISLAETWIAAAARADDLDALEKVWANGVAAIQEAQDKAAYDEFKAYITKRKKEVTIVAGTAPAADGGAK